jgi:hypothetical protein
MDLTEVERQHGFVFGVPDDADLGGAQVVKTVACPTVGCPRSGGTPLPVHEDTVLPVLCGGCGAVLHCEHKPGAQSESITGTLGTPRLRIVRHCTVCAELLECDERDLPPVRLEDLPASALAQLGVVFPGA